MKWFHFCSLLVVVPVLFAQETEEPVRRRRRIIVYDQSTNLITPGSGVEQDSAVEKERRRRLERESSQSTPGLRSEAALPGLMSITPSMPAQTFMPEAEETEEWITAEDLLSVEDLLATEVTDPPDVKSGEMEITNWESLQKEMIKEEISGSTWKQAQAIQEQKEEMLAEMSGRDSGRRSMSEADPGSSGLKLETAVETSLRQTERIMDAGNGSGNLERGSQEITVPILQPILLAGERGVPVLGDPAMSAAEEFGGSRKLLESIQNRQDRPILRTEFSAQAPRAFSTSNGLPAASPSAFSRTPDGFSPSAPRPDALSSSPRSLQPIRAPAPQERSPAPQAEPRTRMRSQLGAGF